MLTFDKFSKSVQAKMDETGVGQVEEIAVKVNEFCRIPHAQPLTFSYREETPEVSGCTGG